MTSGRTLSHVGEKDTHCVVQSVSDTTHSYTIQIHMSLAGKLGKKLYICFKEKEGKFGPLVSQIIEANTPSNVVVAASSSGKLEKVHVAHWIKNAFSLDLKENNNNLLLLDSWTGQKDSNLFQNINGKNIHVEVIPPKTTKYCQPLDVFFFRQYKIMIRKIEDAVRHKFFIEGSEIKLKDRVFIMKMHSIAYHQFNAPILKDMILFAWQKSGYATPMHIHKFQGILQSAFTFTTATCQMGDCKQSAFMRCLYCNLVLCFDHFIIACHEC